MAELAIPRTTAGITRDSFNKNKNWREVIFQMGKPVMDAELNEAQQTNDYRMRKFIESFGNYFIGDGFKVCQSLVLTANNFAVTVGEGFVGGVFGLLQTAMEYNAQAPAVAETHLKQFYWNSIVDVPVLTTPGTDREDLVVLNFVLREIDSNDDIDIVDDTYLSETAYRWKVEVGVSVLESIATTAGFESEFTYENSEGCWRTPIAWLSRPASVSIITSGMITDIRRTTLEERLPDGGLPNQIFKNNGLGRGSWGVVVENLGALDSITTIHMTRPILIDIATGTAPISIASMTLVPNLNADMVDNIHVGNTINSIPINNGSLNLSLNSDLFDGYHAGNSLGSIPINNGTVNTNLNADMLDDLHLSLQSLASTVAGRDGFGDLVARVFKSEIAQGSSPLSVMSTTVSPNLNADLFDGAHLSQDQALASLSTIKVPDENSIAIFSALGWVKDNDAWAWSSDSGRFNIISVAGNKTSRYSKGMKFKCDQLQALTSYWAFDTNSSDPVGSNNGSDTDISYAGTHFGNNAAFNGSTSKISIVDASNLKPTSDFTLGFWIKSSTTALQVLFQSFSANTALAGLKINVNAAGKVLVTIGNNTGTVEGLNYTTVTGSTVVTDNTDRYIVITFKNNFVQIFVNGVLDGSGVMMTPAYHATNYVLFGIGNNTGTANVNPYNGTIDDAFLINGYALDENTILNKYFANLAQGSGSITVTKRFKIRQVTLVGGSTYLNLEGGTDFRAMNASITNCYSSAQRDPFGFDQTPTKWEFEGDIGVPEFLTALGTFNTIALVPARSYRAVLGLQTGMRFDMKIAYVTTSSLVTVYFPHLLQSVGLKRPSSNGVVNIAVGALATNNIAQMIYDGTQFQVIGGLPAIWE